MQLSSLQNYILTRLYQFGGRLKKQDFLDFYGQKKVVRTIALKDIAKSIDRLVMRDLAKSAGVKTAKKWYTNSVVLTPKGKKLAQKLLSRQPKLPFKK